MLSRFFLVSAVAVLAFAGLPGESPGASAKKQCIKETCKSQKKSSTAAFKSKFGTSKAACADLKGKERRLCKKAAKGAFRESRKRCKLAFRDCKKCCRETQITACSVAVCGDSMAVAGEECDGPDDSACQGRCQEDCTCGAPVTTTTTSTSTTTTTTLRFVDNVDGTITDNQTGLQWEKKDDAGGIHDVNNTYTWAGCCDRDCRTSDNLCQPNAAAAAACAAETNGAVGCSECSAGTCEVDPNWHGATTTIWEWLVQVNAEGGSGFAGYSDWRIPSEDGCNDCYTESPSSSCPCDPAELESILLAPHPCTTSPCIDPIFGPTMPNHHWTSSPFAGAPIGAWFVYFHDGNVNGNLKEFAFHVRAVRGGP